MNTPILKLSTMVLLAAWSGSICASSLTLTVNDNIAELVSGDSADYDVSHTISNMIMDSAYSRGTSDVAVATYRITGQVSTDSALFSNDDAARLIGNVDFQFVLPTSPSDIALWNIKADVRYEGIVGVDSTFLPDASASTGPLTISSTGPASGISFTLLPEGALVPAGSTAVKPFSRTSYDQVTSALPGGGYIRVGVDVISSSGGDESYAGFGQMSGLSSYDLDDELNAYNSFSNDGIFVTLTFTPHLNFSGQTLTGAITLGSSEVVTGFGAIKGAVTGSGAIMPNGAFTLGDASLSNAINYGGALDVSNKTVTLLGQNAALLYGATTISGGTLSAVNGIKAEGTLTGNGNVNGPISGTGVITAMTGQLTLGSAVRSDGFDFGGTLIVGNNVVTLKDLDEAKLGLITTLNGGMLVAANGLKLLGGGQFLGAGSITGDFINEGSLEPTNIGAVDLTIAGDYIQTANGSLLIDINGVTDNAYDVLQLFGRASLGGTLQVNFDDGFVPGANDVFTFMLVSGGITGEFGALYIPGYNASDFRVVYGLDSVSLAAVPEPESYVLMGFGLALVGFMANRRKQPEA